MRKVYSLLLLALMFIVSSNAVQAQKRYQVAGADVTTSLTSDEIAGQPFVIASGAVAAEQKNDYIRGLVKSEQLTDENLYEVEAYNGETEAGETIYILKRVATGDYLENSNGKVSYTTTKARAWQFVVLETTTVTSEDLNNTDAPLDDYAGVTTTTPTATGLVFYDATGDKSTKGSGYFFCGNTEGKSPAFSKTDFSTNVLNCYAVEELTGGLYLEAAIQELGYTSETTASDLYTAGDQPGNISQELFDALDQAFSTVSELISNESDDQEACVAAYNALQTALTNAAAGVILVKEGYYFFRSNRSEVNATYDLGDRIAWTYNQTWAEPETYTVADTKYMWHIIPDASNEGAYYIQNIYTSRYVGIASSKGEKVSTTVNPEYSFLIYPMGKVSGSDEVSFAIQSTYLIEHPVEGWNNVQCTALHCAGDHDGVVVWSCDAGTITGSGWRFYNVDMDQLNALYSQIDQVKRNTALQTLYDEAKAKYEAGFSYNFNGNRSGELDNEEDGSVKGLVTSVDQIASNSIETAEGAQLEGLIDNSIADGNFYHSIWNSSSAEEQGFDVATTYPNIRFDLSKACSEISVKMWPRRNGSTLMSNNLPGKVIVWANNTGLDAEEWDSIGVFNNALTYQYIGDDDTKSNGNAVSLLRIVLGKEYKYVRLDVATRLGSSTDFVKNAKLATSCWNCAELRVFESWYDESISLNTGVPADVKEAFVAKLDEAKAELDAESATQATIDGLQAAYDKYLDNLPDPTIITTAINEAKSQLEGAEEGSDYGYFEAGATETFNTELAAIQAEVKDVMTVAEIQALKAKITAALAAFNAKLILPADGAYIRIQSKTADGKAKDAYIRCEGNGVERNRWYNLSSDENQDDNIAYVWKFIKGENNTFKLQSAFTGEYLNAPKASGKGVGMSTQADTCSFTIRTAKVAGLINVVFADDVYMNADPSGPLVTWYSASGTDNSAFAIYDADIDNYSTIYYDVTANATNFITLPVAVTADANCYSVVGRNGDNVVLAKLSGTIEAGTPFVYNETDGFTFAMFDAVQTDAAQYTFATEAKTVNGLAGTLAPLSQAPVGYGILFNHKTIVDAQEGDGVAHNSAYILPTIPTTTEAGDATIAIDGKIDAINNATVNTEAAFVNVYTLAGVKVRSAVKAGNATNGLPAGLYIVGSKKVLVK